jgi:hypothetical protein
MPENILLGLDLSAILFLIRDLQDLDRYQSAITLCYKQTTSSL